jgi:hypothetical protein
MDQIVGLVAGIDEFTLALVFLGMRLGILDHALDLVLGQPARGLDLNGLFPAGLLVAGRDVEDAVRVDVERHLDLRHAARRRRDVAQVEAPEGLVVARHLALALQDVDRHGRLIVLGRREHLRRLGRNRGVLLDELGHHPAHGLDAERQRRHVEQQHVLDVAAEHAGLNGRADRHGFVRVDVLARLLAEELLDLLLHLRHARLAADEDDLVDVLGGQLGVLERGLAGLDRTIDQVLDQGLELGPGHLHVEVLGPVLVRRDVGQIDLGLLCGGQFDLGLLAGLLEPLQRQRIVVQVDAAFLLEGLGEVIDDRQVEVFAAQERIAVGGQHLELVLAVHLRDLDDGDVEGAAAEVVYRDLLVTALLVQAIGQRRRGGLVDDALDRQPGDPARVLGGLALGVVEVRRDRDHGIRDFLAQVFLGGGLHLLQDPRGNLRRRHLLVVRLDPGIAVVGLHDLVGDVADVLLDLVLIERAPDQPLHAIECVVRVGHGLALGRGTDQDFAVVCERDHGRCRAIPLAVLDHPRLVALHDGDARVRGPQIDPDHLTHDVYSSNSSDILYGLRPDTAEHGARGAPFQAPYLATMTSAGRSSRSLRR